MFGRDLVGILLNDERFCFYWQRAEILQMIYEFPDGFGKRKFSYYLALI